MANVNIVLDTRRMKNDHSYPVYLRLTYNRKARNINSGLTVKESDWNFRKNCVKSSHPNSARINHKLNKLVTDSQRVLLDLGDTHQYSIEELKQALISVNNKPQRVPSFKEYGQRIIDRYKTANKHGSADCYKCCCQAVLRFTGNKDLSLKSINYQFLLDLEAFHLGNGVRVNTLGGYMRHLRAIINMAIDDGYLGRSQYPFEKFRIKKEKTAKRAISKAEILKISNVDLSNKKDLEQVQQYFTFMFHMRGMNYVDMAKLRMRDISNDRVIYRRQKTGKVYNVKLTDKAKAIIQHFTTGKGLKGEDYVFPIIKADVLGEVEREWLCIKEARRQFNNKLKKIGALVGIKANLTSYVIRHSWASIAKFSGIAPSVIGESLGHSDLSTTEVYLAQFEHGVLDEANDLITS